MKFGINSLGEGYILASWYTLWKRYFVPNIITFDSFFFIYNQDFLAKNKFIFQ